MNFIHVNEVSLIHIRGILKMKLLSTLLPCGRLKFRMLHLSLFMSFHSGTGCFLWVCRVQNSRASSNRFMTRNRNFHACFLNVQGTGPWINKGFEFFVSLFTEDHPLFAPAVVFRNSKEHEIWSIISAILTNSYSSILYHANPPSKSTKYKKTHWNVSWVTKHMALLCLFSLKPRTLFPRASLRWLKFGTGLTPKYVEIGLWEFFLQNYKNYTNHFPSFLFSWEKKLKQSRLCQSLKWKTINLVTLVHLNGDK